MHYGEKTNKVFERSKKGERSRLACLIATHKRYHLTSLAIKSIRMQSSPVDLFIVGSDPEDKRVAEDNSCNYLNFSNEFLSEKWQAGLNFIKSNDKFTNQYDGVIILGSDDVLSSNYCQKALNYIDMGYALVGKSSWFILSKFLLPSGSYKKSLYNVWYNNPPTWQPLGAGRIYSREFMNSINWKLFFPKTQSQLDAHGFLKVLGRQKKIAILNSIPNKKARPFKYPFYFCADPHEARCNLEIIDFVKESEANILSIKDDQTEQINPMDKIFKALENSDSLGLLPIRELKSNLDLFFGEELCAELLV